MIIGLIFRKLLIIFLVLIFVNVHVITAKSDTYEIGAGDKEEEEVEQVRVGNFALPTSQQPGPFIAFGQNVVDKGDTQLFTYVDYLKGQGELFAEVIPSFLYGIRDDLSLFVEVPIAAKFQLGSDTSHGLEDLYITAEYVFYSKNKLESAFLSTLVTTLILPTGSANKTPSTGLGVPSFFLGLTAGYMDTEWYYYGSLGAILTTVNKGIEIGNQFLYQWGLGKNISYAADSYIFNWLIEFDGTYRQKDKIKGITDQDSGGNVIFLGPSLWFSTQRIIVQVGVSWVIAQHLFGVQEQDHYIVVGNLGWKF